MAFYERGPVRNHGREAEEPATRDIDEVVEHARRFLETRESVGA